MGAGKCTGGDIPEALSEVRLGVMQILPVSCKMPAPAYGVATRMGWAGRQRSSSFYKSCETWPPKSGHLRQSQPELHQSVFGLSEEEVNNQCDPCP